MLGTAGWGELGWGTGWNSWATSAHTTELPSTPLGGGLSPSKLATCPTILRQPPKHPQTSEGKDPPPHYGPGARLTTGRCRPQTTGKHHAKKGILQTPKPPRQDRWDPEPRAMLKPPNPLQGEVDAPPHSSVGHLRVLQSPPPLRTEPKVDVKGCARSKGCRPAFTLTGRAPWKHTPGLNRNHLPDTLQSGAG